MKEQEQEKKAGDISSKSASKELAREAKKANGLYNVTYLKDHGNHEKDDESQMHHSTAKALAAHKVVKIGAKVKVVKKEKR